MSEDLKLNGVPTAIKTVAGTLCTALISNRNVDYETIKGFYHIHGQQVSETLNLMSTYVFGQELDL
jgi:hypothetical protein